jgi:methionyl-tRNA formyltransferase
MADVAPEPMRIVLFIREPMGTLYQRAQQVIAGSGHRLVGVLTSAGPPTRRTDRYQELVAQTPRSTDLIVSNFPSRWAGLVAPLRPDLVLILGFSWKVPDDVLALPRIGTVNWHGALLPNYRGRGDWALQWMLRNDEPAYGITFHWVDADWDTGPILTQGPVPIEDDDDVGSILTCAVDLTVELLPEVLAMAARREPGTPQSGGFYCGPIEPEWRNIDWNAPARTVHNQVRSWLGQGATATIDGVPTRVIRTRLIGLDGASAPPGAVLARDGETLVVQCGDHPLQILQHYPEPRE